MMLVDKCHEIVSLAQEEGPVFSTLSETLPFAIGVAASAVMAALLFAASLAYPLLSRLFLAKEIAVLVVCAAGAGAYGLCLLLFRAVTLSELKATLRREPGAGPVSGLD